jgi:hypothetical protein
VDEKTLKEGEEMTSLNEEIDIDQVSPEDLEEVAGGDCGCFGIFNNS